MTLPSIHIIRERLGQIKDAVIDDPMPTTVDRGDMPYAPISRPQERKEKSDAPLAGSIEEPVDEETAIDDEPSIIFEIPPDLDDRTVRETLGRYPGSNFERLTEVSGTDALGWYLPFHYHIAQHGIYISSVGTLQLAIHCFRRKYSDNRDQDQVV